MELAKARGRDVQGEVDGREYTVKAPFLPTAPRYPQVETHLWGEFAVLAVEAGGYNDLSAVDPYTGRSIWTRAFEDDVDIYTALRRLIDAMEAANFLPADDPDA